jgi:hypothetical protein
MPEKKDPAIAALERVYTIARCHFEAAMHPVLCQETGHKLTCCEKYAVDWLYALLREVREAVEEVLPPRERAMGEVTRL